jgi:hypothetical protein
MEVSSGTPLGYASVAILTALLKHLAEFDVVSRQAIADILVEATKSLDSFGRGVGVPAAITVVAEVRSDLAKQGIV